MHLHKQYKIILSKNNLFFLFKENDDREPLGLRAIGERSVQTYQFNEHSTQEIHELVLTSLQNRSSYKQKGI